MTSGFQTLNKLFFRLFFRSASKSAMDCPSTPAAPWFAFTCQKASQTSRFEISNDLPCDFSLLMQLLPGPRPG